MNEQQRLVPYTDPADVHMHDTDIPGYQAQSVNTVLRLKPENMSKQEKQNEALSISQYTGEPYDPEWGELMGAGVTAKDREKAVRQIQVLQQRKRKSSGAANVSQNWVVTMNRASWLRGVVMGLDDGLVTTLVAIMTLSGVVGTHLFATMIGVVLASAISMALGGYASAQLSHDAHPITQGLQTGGAFIIGGLAPLVPVALRLPGMQWWSYGCTALVALAFGWLKWRYGEQASGGWLKSALFFLVIVSAGTLVGVVIGWLLP